MNKLIKSLDYSKLLFIDIETASQKSGFECPEDNTLVDVYSYKNRNKETEEEMSFNDLEEYYRKNAALSPIFGRVVCVTLGSVKNDKIVLKSYNDEDEAVLLEKVTKDLALARRTIVGYNINGFDLPYVRMRCNILGVDYPENLSDTMKKPWEMDNVSLDLMKVFQGTCPFRFSLEELCYAYNIPSSKNGAVKGSGVSKAFHEGRIKEITEYCEEDVRATINLFRAFRGENLL